MQDAASNPPRTSRVPAAREVDRLVLRLKLRAAWESWIRPILSLLVLLLVLALHALEVLTPWQTGTLLAVGLVIIPVTAAAFRVLKAVASLRQTLLLLAWLATLAGTSLSLVYAGAIPGELLLATRLTPHARGLEIPVDLQERTLNMLVSGHIPENGTARYTLSMSYGRDTQRLSGIFERKEAASRRQRVSTEGAQTTESRYSLELPAPLKGLYADRMEPPLKGLEVSLYRPYFSVNRLLPLVVLLALLSLWMDATWCLPSQPSYMPVTAGFVLSFSYTFARAATQLDTPGNVMGAGLLSTLLAIPSAVMLSLLCRRLLGKQRRRATS